MKYLKDENVLDRKGNEISIQVLGENKVLTTGLFLYFVLNAYQPIQGFNLKPNEIRYYNKILDKLEDSELKKGCWEFEDSEWLVIKSVFQNIAPLIPLLATHTDIMEDKMNGVLNELPKE